MTNSYFCELTILQNIHLLTILMTDSIFKQTTKNSDKYYAARFAAIGI